MADAIVSPLLVPFIELVVSKGKELLEFNDQFENMKGQLEWMECFLKDVKKTNARLDTPHKVRSDLTELMYDAEDIIADYELFCKKQEQRRMPKFVKYISRKHRRIRKRLLKLNQKIKEVSDYMKTYLYPASNPTRSEKEDENQSSNYPILINEADIVGLEDDCNELSKWILGASGPPMVIGIVGLGGIGKTTLAQKIYNNVKNSFLHAVQVTVSQSIKLDQLLSKMLKKLEVEEKNLSGKEIEDLLTTLKDKLDGKYLLFLDDVWEIDEKQWWDSLKSALPHVTGSCIIVTTRNEGIAKKMGATNMHIHHPQILSDDNSWSLFCKVAFVNTDGKCLIPGLEDVGRQIVARCEGLPLAIKVVGGVMLQKDRNVKEWTRVLDHFKEELAIDKNDLIISRLKLSYENLPAYLKPCFLSLALYPEDFIFSFCLLTYYWIGEGLISGRNGKTAIEIGNEYLVELVNRCLIIVEEKDIYEMFVQQWRVHDMVRDMAVDIAKKENFAEFIHKDKPSSNTKQRRRVAIYKDTTPTSVRKYTKLRTLLEWEIESKEVVSDLNTKLGEFRWLRVLRLDLLSTEVDEHVPSKNWLSGIGSLQHLVFFGISNSALEMLPDSIGNLCNLQVFLVRNCPNLERLPSSIALLEKLIVIDVSRCDSLKYWPKGIAKLSNLERLALINFTCNDGFRISQLKNFTKLRQLAVVINYKGRFEEGELNALLMLEHLQYLYIEVGDHSQRAELSSKIDRLQPSPLKSLEDLRLVYVLAGERTPVWLNPTSFPNLRFLVISEGNIKSVGPEFSNSKHGVWKVERLVLNDLYEFEEEWSSIRKAMPSLTLLKVRDCPKLKSFPIDVTSSEYITWRSEQSL